MTKVKEANMVHDDDASSNGRRILWIIVASFGLIMTAGAIAGFLSAMSAQGNGNIDAVSVAVLAVFVTIIGALAFTIWNLTRKMRTSQEKVPRREKLYNRILVGCMIFGGIIGLTLAISGSSGTRDTALFGSGALPPMIALALAASIGIFMPVLTYYWHKNAVDELEEAAYRAGTLFAMYAFWFVAPVWWLLWRGGFLPSPDGVALYTMTMFVALFVWAWKKYR
jgi:hypothetical protein